MMQKLLNVNPFMDSFISTCNSSVMVTFLLFKNVSERLENKLFNGLKDIKSFSLAVLFTVL